MSQTHAPRHDAHDDEDIRPVVAEGVDDDAVASNRR